MYGKLYLKPQNYFNQFIAYLKIRWIQLPNTSNKLFKNQKKLKISEFFLRLKFFQPLFFLRLKKFSHFSQIPDTPKLIFQLGWLLFSSFLRTFLAI